MTSEPLNLDREEAISRLSGALIGPPPAGVEAGTPGDDLDQRQTCLVLTLADTARANLHGTIDLIKTIARDECGIPEDSLHMGGPPVDNVSIDKAGQTSVTILFGLSLVVGFIVSWWSLKSKALVGMVIASGVYSMFASLAVVWYSGYPVDAILLTMPSLVYVATTSGAIHLANYYRDQLRCSTHFYRSRSPPAPRQSAWPRSPSATSCRSGCSASSRRLAWWSAF
jgi:hypothetical protein